LPNQERLAEHSTWPSGLCVRSNASFATGSLALTDLQLATQAGSANDVIAGWTVGAGVEFAFADNWTLKAGYLFVDFGATQCFSGRRSVQLRDFQAYR
jgi:opacity protein-like surface antigen